MERTSKKPLCERTEHPPYSGVENFNPFYMGLIIIVGAIRESPFKNCTNIARAVCEPPLQIII